MLLDFPENYAVFAENADLQNAEHQYTPTPRRRWEIYEFKF